MRVKDFFETVQAAEGSYVMLPIEPSTGYGVVAGEEGPEKVGSVGTNVLVPLFDWLSVDEDEVLTQLVIEAGKANPLNLASPSKITSSFWAKQQQVYTSGLLAHPDLKILIPQQVPALRSELVSKDMLLLFNRPKFVGKYVRAGRLRGALAHDRKGILLIRFFAP